MQEPVKIETLDPTNRAWQQQPKPDRSVTPARHKKGNRGDVQNERAWGAYQDRGGEDDYGRGQFSRVCSCDSGVGAWLDLSA